MSISPIPPPSPPSLDRSRSMSCRERRQCQHGRSFTDVGGPGNPCSGERHRRRAHLQGHPRRDRGARVDGPAGEGRRAPRVDARPHPPAGGNPVRARVGARRAVRSHRTRRPGSRCTAGGFGPPVGGRRSLRRTARPVTAPVAHRRRTRTGRGSGTRLARPSRTRRRHHVDAVCPRPALGCLAEGRRTCPSPRQVACR